MNYTGDRHGYEGREQVEKSLEKWWYALGERKNEIQYKEDRIHVCK